MAISTLFTGGIPSYADAQTENAAPYAFRGDQENRFGEFSIDPFYYRGEPMPVGSFILRPNLQLKLQHDDNVLATENNTKSDFVSVLEPSLVVQKPYGRHNFILSTQAEIRRYADQENENVENFGAAFEADFEALRGLNIPVSVAYRSSHFDRKNQKALSIADLTTEPLGIKTLQVEGGINYKPNRLGVELLGTYRQARLDNGTISGTDAAAIRDNRDVDVKQAQLEVSYETLNNFTPFLQLRLADEEFVNEAPGATTRNNNLIRVLGGTSFNFKGLLYGFLGIGREQRTYDSDEIEKARALSMEGDIYWEPTEKLRLGLKLGRSTSEESTIVTGVTETEIDFSLDYELQRDLFARVLVGYDHDDFKDLDRQDKTYEGSAELLYIIGPQLQLGAGYMYRHRDSTTAGLGLDNNIFTIRAITGF